MHKQNIGFTTMCLGAMAGDSEKMWVPFALIAAGIMLIYLGSDRH